MRNEEWFVMRPQNAEAYGRPQGREFLVRKGQTPTGSGHSKVAKLATRGYGSILMGANCGASQWVLHDASDCRIRGR